MQYEPNSEKEDEMGRERKGVYGWSRRGVMKAKPDKRRKVAGKTLQTSSGKVSKWWGGGGVGEDPWGWALNVSGWDCSTCTCWSKGMVEQCPKEEGIGSQEEGSKAHLEAK